MKRKLDYSADPAPPRLPGGRARGLLLPVLMSVLALQAWAQPATPDGTADRGRPAARERMYAAMQQVQEGGHEAAIPVLREVIATDPALSGAWETLGQALWALGRRDEVAALAERWLRIAPHEPGPYRLMGRVATGQGRLLDAAALLEQSLELEPDHYDTLLAYAQVLLWDGRRGEAVERLRRLHRINPERLDVEIDLAWALFADEEYEQALRHWDHICALQADEPGFLAARAEVLLYMGDLEQSEAQALAILDLEPGHRKALDLLAEVAMRRGHPEEVVDALIRVIDRAEEDRDRVPLLLLLASKMQDYHGSDPARYPASRILAVLEEAVRRDPLDVQALLFLGEVYMMDRQFLRAESAFQKALEDFNAFNQRARNGLVEVYLALNRMEDAERQLRDNLRVLNERDPYRHVLWARIHFQAGRIREAHEALDRLEDEGLGGAVFTVLYHGLSPSEWTAMPSVRQVREHLTALRDAGFSFVTPSEMEAYFAALPPPPAREAAPWGQRVSRAIRQGLGAGSELPPRAADLSPEKVASVHFDDGLRTSFRWGTPLMQDLGIRAAMSLAVGLVEDRDVYIATWPEIREAQRAGAWEMGSHLMDASLLAPIDAGGRAASRLANRMWLEEDGRLESMREFGERLRHEYQQSKMIMMRELGLEPGEIRFQVPPMGDIGQELGTNIRPFNVPRLNLNEAMVHYPMGFLQSPYGYALPSDHPQMLQRYEPGRDTPAREVVLQAYRAHPVYMARHMRAEFAALMGQGHMAMDMVAALRRDGYPEELLDELNFFVRSRLAGEVTLPGTLHGDPGARTPTVTLRHPFAGVELRETKANVQIEERMGLVFGGLELTPRLTLQAHAGQGRIKQEIKTDTWVEQQQAQTSSQIVETIGETGTSVEEQRVTTFSTVTVKETEIARYRADEERVGGQVTYRFDGGTVGMVEAARHTFGDHLEGESMWSYAGEIQWLPTLFLAAALRYEHDRVPSARALVEYDSLLLRGRWQVRDGWHSEGISQYAYYDDENAMLMLALENLWRLSAEQDVWIGFASRMTTTDADSELYWSPYWDQRHYFIGRLRRAYPGYFAILQVNLGWQREKARQEALEAYRDLRTRGEQEGWYPGSGPQGSWEPMIGVSASVDKRWQSGWEASAEVSANVLSEYIERVVTARLRYRF